MSIKSKEILKKTFWIVLAIIGISILAILVLPLIFKNKETTKSPIREIIEKTQLEIDKASIDAKIEIAKAAGKEEAVIKRLETIKTEPDRRIRLEKLSQLLD